MKITTESGSVYIHRGCFLTRLSEKPIISASSCRPLDNVVNNELIEFFQPEHPVVGERIYYRLANGDSIHTTRVTEIDMENNNV